jgi:tRNA(Ile)-lysidine synthase
MHRFEIALTNSWPPARRQDVTVLLAVSGGADSVALLRGMAALGPASAGKLVVAHYNHRLRGDESDADERFVVELAGRLDLEVRVGRALAPPPGPSESAEPDDRRAASAADDPADRIAPQAPRTSEERSRGARYDFLAHTARELGARYVATAHTADDQVETVLHHVLRGTGLAGLAGMPAARELTPGIALVRPLLAMRRSEVLAYLSELGQAFRDDDTNRDLGYTRNRLRHELLPRLAADYNPRIVDALLRLGALAADAKSFIEAQASSLAERCVTQSGPARILIDTTLLSTAPRALVREVLIAAWRAQGWPMQGMGYDQWELLATLAAGPAGSQTSKRVLPGEVLAERAEDRLTLSHREA